MLSMNFDGYEIAYEGKWNIFVFIKVGFFKIGFLLMNNLNI